MARQRIETDAVLEWLAEHHPDLHQTAEVDRSWVWLCCGDKLKGDEPEKKAVRKSIGDFGFRFARKGHPMESGSIGIWAHSCLAPKKFQGGGGGKPKSTKPQADTNSRPTRFDPLDAYDKLAEKVEPAQTDSDIAAGLAFFNS